jgi:hypothetical protein
MRTGRAEKARGDHGPRGNGSTMSYANWHVRAMLQLDSAKADSILVGLLREPEYEWVIAEELIQLTKPPNAEKQLFNKVDYAKVWEARATPPTLIPR